MLKVILNVFIVAACILNVSAQEQSLESKQVSDLIEKARLYMGDQKDYRKAIESLEKAAMLAPDNPKIFLNLGANYLYLDKLDKAEENFKKAVSLDPTYIEAYNNLATLYRISEKYDLAIQHYKKAIEFNPQYAEVYTNLGMTYNRVEQYKEAIKVLSKGLELKPLSRSQEAHKALTYMNIGYAYFVLGEYSLAKNSLFKAVELYKSLGDHVRLNYLNFLLNQIEKDRKGKSK
ncbi:MAG: tetratricopeptide repeat protein [Candidatus Omnitrophota bacterium]|nr:MAG: tetratricopeptide repeat protein [Candidatus Omnitrophota bacterium]